VYHFEDKDIIDIANLLILKGFQNILVLKGGIKKFSSLYPDLIEGKEIPHFELEGIFKREKKNDN
jgi:hypothetical protein